MTNGLEEIKEKLLPFLLEDHNYVWENDEESSTQFMDNFIYKLKKLLFFVKRNVEYNVDKEMSSEIFKKYFVINKIVQDLLTEQFCFNNNNINEYISKGNNAIIIAEKIQHLFTETGNLKFVVDILNVIKS